MRETETVENLSIIRKQRRQTVAANNQVPIIEDFLNPKLDDKPLRKMQTKVSVYSKKQTMMSNKNTV